jgi:hypothetical protein
VQNDDGTFPPPFSLLATDKKGRGVTEWIQDISVNSVTLFGQATTGTLTYSDASGLLLNSGPVSGGSFSGLTSANAGVGIDISGTALNPIIGLVTPVPFNSVASTVPLDELAQSYNELLAALNGKIISVNLPDSITPITVSATGISAQLSWSPAPSGYGYTVYLNGIAQFPDTVGPGYTLTNLEPLTTYTVAVAAHNNNVFSSPLVPTTFTTTNYVQGFIIQTEYQTAAAPFISVLEGSYFDSTAFGIVNASTAIIDMTGDRGIVPYVDPGQATVIYQSIFCLSPPTDVLNMVLWVDCDDGCAIRITDPDTKVVTDLINTFSAWEGGPGPQGGGPYKYPGTASGNGILLNLYAGKYYKIECNSTNNSGADSCSFLYTVPIQSSPPMPVTYTVNTIGDNAMASMSGATFATTIPPFMGTGPIYPSTINLIPTSWYYI